MKILFDLIAALLKLMALGIGLVLILGGGFCVLLPIGSRSSGNLEFAAIGAVMALAGGAVWWSILRPDQEADREAGSRDDEPGEDTHRPRKRK